MATFYFVYLNKNPTTSDDSVKEAMDKALDWYKISSLNWIVYSNSDPDKLYSRLLPLIKDAGHVFICELNIKNRQGWKNKKFWEWLNKDR